MTTEPASTPSTMAPPSDKRHADHVDDVDRLSGVENKARNVLESLAARSRSTNYVSLLFGYARHAVQPAVQKWNDWNSVQRIIAICSLLPWLSAPVMTAAFFAPLIVLLAAIGYIAVMGKECACQHYNEAVREHFGAESLTVDSFKQRAEALRARAEGGRHNICQSALHFAAHGISRVLIGLIAVLDFLVTALMSLSRMAGKQKRSVQGYKSKLEERAEDKPRHHLAAKPVSQQ